MLTPLLLAFLPALQEPAETWPITGLPKQDAVCESILQEAEENNLVMQHLAELVDGIGPRLTSSTKLTEAIEWAAKRFEGFGFNEVRIEQWGEFPIGFDRRLMTGRVLAPQKEPIVFATQAWQPGTNGPERGPLLEVPQNEEELEANRGKYKNAWVLLTGTKSPKWDSDADTFRAKLGQFFDEEGIYGTLRIARNDLVLTGGRYKIDSDNLPTRTSITVTKSQGRQFSKWITSEENVQVEFDLDYTFIPGPIPQYNVIAEIPGTDKADELLIFGGHIDSWDGATGTNDNGTGTATTMEAARLLAAALREQNLQPRRTIRFMLWSGEEQGLLGSRAYIEQHPEEMDRISGVLVHDGGTNYLSGINATPMLMPIFEEVLEPIDRMVANYEDSEIKFNIRSVDSLPLGIGSDHDSYLRKGVPGFFWNQAGESNYTYVHHTQHDTYENAIASYEEHSAKVIAMTAWRLANTEQMLPREDILSAKNNNQSGRNRRLLGVYLSDDGLDVVRIAKEGMAEQAGIVVGDIFTSLGGQALETRGDLRRAARVDEDIKEVIVKRGDKFFACTFNWKENSATALKEMSSIKTQ